MLVLVALVVQIKRLVPDRRCLKRAESDRWPNGGNGRDSRLMNVS